MRAGDCFYGAPPRCGNVPHYWLVLCDPDGDGNVAVVNLTTPQGETKAHIHSSLRCTPAMAAGITTKVWELADVADLLDVQERLAA